METKELKIQVPEGYEIDKENSTFECIKFKSIRNDITYAEICDKIFNNNIYSINRYGNIKCNHIGVSRFDLKNDTSINQLKKIFIEWLTNGQPKILQLESGELIIVSITGNPKLTKDVTFIDVVDFSWVESAEVNSANLRNLRLSEFYYGTMYYEDEFLEVN